MTLPTYDSWAPFYDLTDADRAPFVEFYSGLLADHTCSLLEVGCGTGTVTMAVGERIRERHGAAARVVGVDESPRMLDAARLRYPPATWVRGDLRAPPVTGQFDLIMCCFSTLQCLLRDADLVQAFAAVRALCASNGTFAFDVYQPNLEYLRTQHSDHVARTVVGPDGRRLEIREDTAYDETARILTIDWRLVDALQPEAPPLAELRQHVRQYFPVELERLLAASGLAIRERYGGLDRSPPGEQSKKQVIVCEPA